MCRAISRWRRFYFDQANYLIWMHARGQFLDFDTPQRCLSKLYLDWIPTLDIDSNWILGVTALSVSFSACHGTYFRIATGSSVVLQGSRRTAETASFVEENWITLSAPHSEEAIALMEKPMCLIVLRQDTNFSLVASDSK